jgi:hypothetical protein
MGIINNDLFVASNGAEKSGTYISFSNETLYLRKNEILINHPTTYAVHANARIFWDKAARDAQKPFLELRTVNANVSDADLSGNLYAILYAELKKQYPNSVDE